MISKQEKNLTMTVLMTPDMANFSGHVHGGSLLKLLDQVAYACAAKFCKNYVVTAALDQVFFREQVDVGELVTFLAHVNHVGRSSMEIGIKVIAENLRTHRRRHTTSCYFTMVAVDDKGKPQEVPQLLLETETEKRQFAEAELRKKFRLQTLEETRSVTSELSEED
jgi:acyl-CoA hydrolase